MPSFLKCKLLPSVVHCSYCISQHFVLKTLLSHHIAHQSQCLANYTIAAVQGKLVIVMH